MKKNGGGSTGACLLYNFLGKGHFFHGVEVPLAGGPWLRPCTKNGSYFAPLVHLLKNENKKHDNIPSFKSSCAPPNANYFMTHNNGSQANKKLIR